MCAFLTGKRWEEGQAPWDRVLPEHVANQLIVELPVQGPLSGHTMGTDFGVRSTDQLQSIGRWGEVFVYAYLQKW